MSDGFTLGGITFSDWETPTRLALPSGHKLNKHMLIGGQRVIDAMGYDPEPMRWSARSRTPASAGQMAALKAMCDAGQTVTLTWNTYSYQVIIEKCGPVYRTPIEWEYTVTCEIVSDSSGTSLGGAVSSLDSLIGGDLSTALSLAS